MVGSLGASTVRPRRSGARSLLWASGPTHIGSRARKISYVGWARFMPCYQRWRPSPTIYAESASSGGQPGSMNGERSWETSLGERYASVEVNDRIAFENRRSQ